ncbi:MAG TPA: hypothetical protein DCQ28_04020, partial [Bacteroidetes bacterium]|nr:hypothetical protein [Bacteroidota bacterium]
NAVKQIEQMLVRDELYRTEISQKITITDKEIKTALQRSSNELKVYFLFARTKELADSLYSLIRKGKLLESFSFTQESRNDCSGPDSAIARWGDVDERMENVIYTLKQKETSKPFQLDDGWYIAKVMKRTTTIVAGEREQIVQRQKVETRLRQRKEFSRMSDFMSSALRSTTTDINSRLFKSTIIHLWNIAQQQHPVRTDSTMFFIDKTVITLLHESMGDSLHFPFVTFPHTVWSVETALEKIVGTNLATANPTLNKIRIDVEQRLRDLIDQEYLTQIGYTRGLNQSSSVRKDLKVWRDSYLSQIVKNKIGDTITVSQNEIEELRREFSNDTSLIFDNNKAIARTKEIKTIGTIDRIIGSVANSTEITFYEQNFKDVHVSSTPSMIFRILGFGGRMPAVPFVIPQLGWINYWQNKDIKFP